MTRPVGGYFARHMEDPEYAAAYQELEAEYEAERAQIQAGVPAVSAEQRMEEVSEYFKANPHLTRILHLLETKDQPQILLTPGFLGYSLRDARSRFQVSSEAHYDATIVSTQVIYNADVS